MIVLEVLIFCLFCIWMKFMFIQWKYYVLGNKLQGPPAYPVIGCMLSFIGHNRYTKLFNITEKYKSPISLWIGPKLCLYIDRPEHIQTIVNSSQCLNKSYFYSFLGRLIGDGLITLNGIKWKNNRKLLNPCFGISRLIGFMQIFNDASKILTNRLENYANGKESLDFFTFASDCSLDLVCKTTMGVDLKLQENENVEYLNAVVNGFEIVSYRMFNFWLQPEWIFKWTKYFKQLKNYSERVCAIPKSILKDKRNELAANKKLRDSFLNDKNEDECSKVPQIHINQLLKLSMQRNDLPDDDIINEISTIVIAGNETSASVVSYAILALAFYPEIQERALNEVMEVFPASDFNVGYEDLSRLIYLEMILKETMRFYPTVPLISRTSSDEFQLDNLTVPAGINIVIGIMKLHKHKDIWGDDADEFNPDHFLPEMVEKRHPYSFIPFGSGSRNCIGQKYAMMSMKTMMVHLLRKYRFTTKLKPDELKFEMQITLKIDTKHMVEVHLRQNSNESTMLGHSH